MALAVGERLVAFVKAEDALRPDTEALRELTAEQSRATIATLPVTLLGDRSCARSRKKRFRRPVSSANPRPCWPT
jgi:hypothetical protein